MGKFVFLGLFFAALMAVSVAQDLTEQSYKDEMCRREVQQNPLYSCRQILHHQLTGGGHQGVPLFQTEWDTRERCCRQLQSVSRGCRCSAIRGMVRDYEATMPPLGLGLGHRQQGGGYYGEEGRGQQGQVLHEMPPWQQQQHQQEAGVQEYYGGETVESQQRQGGGDYGHVRLMQVQRYVAVLPSVCQIEPMECSVFSGDQQLY